MKSWLGLILLIAVMLAVGSFVTHLDRQTNSAVAQHHFHQDYPDIRVRNLQLTHTDARGHHLHHLFADELRHYINRSTELDNINLMMTPADAPNWYTQADHGWIDQKNKLMMLYGSVFLKQEESETSPAIETISRDMIIDYQNSLAYSMAPTTVLNGGHLLSGTGVDIHMKRPVHVSILSNVSGSHVIE
ncbi:MAG TPA: LPS export ABC transporter periplasmic protein LptC [Gammaproteobacteria bacterium]|nr:LPS export ABC transporter periplasmic protein LptC [Gammaproteobacteria bacterium]